MCDSTSIIRERLSTLTTYYFQIRIAWEVLVLHGNVLGGNILIVRHVIVLCGNV